jgi:lipopolysaccharide biosynthesis protein
MGDSALRSVAFYLPQFHPIPENDDWWGTGFTEWRSVVNARPLFRGHPQPHLPADLGFYDLRLAEARAAQAELAARYGIDAFCYYHYWFEGRRLLNQPFAFVLASGEPDFPFCLCWANESWTRTWNGKSDEPLLRQTYSEADDRVHAQWMAAAFADPRYVRVGGRPLFLVYRASALPDARRTTDVWRAEVTRLGIDEPYLCAVQSAAAEHVDPVTLGFDAAVEFAPDFAVVDRLSGDLAFRRALRRALAAGSPRRRNSVRSYQAMVDAMLAKPDVPYTRYRGVTPGFDNSARRPEGGALILAGSTPDAYRAWVTAIVQRRSANESLLFVNAWNEWAEGNHLEPCQRWGTAYLEAHLAAVRVDEPLLRDAGR